MDDDFHSLASKNEYPSPVSPGERSSKSYPTLRLNGEQSEECGADECKHGEEYEMTIRVRCKSIGESYGNEKKPSVTFDILACTDIEECDDEDEEEGEKEEPEAKDDEKPEARKDKPGHLSGRAIIIGGV